MHAHSLKGNSGYIGAAKLHYVCYYIQKAYIDNDYEAMADFYPLLIETAIEVRFQVRVILARVDSKLTLRKLGRYVWNV